MSEKSAAILTIHHAARMTPRGRKVIAHWLRRQAGLLERHADQYAGRYTARYLYTPTHRKDLTASEIIR